MEKNKAEQEVSALITGLMLLGLIVPVLLVWFAGKIATITSYLETIGFLERSERVIWNVSDGAGLDIGRLMIIFGGLIISAIILKYLINICRS